MKFFGLAFLVSLVACSGGGGGGSSAVESQNESPLESAPVDAPVGALSTDAVEVQVLRKVDFDVKNGIRGVLSNLTEFKSQLNVRKIRVTLKDQAFINSDLKLECFEEDSKIKVTAAFRDLSAQIETFELTPKGAASAIVNCSILSGAEVKLQTRVKVLRDILVEKGQTMADLGLLPDQKNEIDALVFGNEAALTTHGKKLILEARLIVADMARIQTFEETDVAAKNQKGLSGGFIKITSRVGVGELETIMRGQSAGSNDSTDATDYLGLEFVRKAYAAQSNKICQQGSTMQTEIYPKDMSGFDGGDAGQFFLKVEDSSLDVDIQSFPGAGGDGGFSRFASKDKVIPAYFTFSEVKRFVKRDGWAFELMDNYTGPDDFEGCALNRRTCSSTFGNGELEYEPNYGAGKYHDRCKVGFINRDTLGTNFYFTGVNLSIPSGYLPTATRGLSGDGGKGCSERITDNVFECN